MAFKILLAHLSWKLLSPVQRTVIQDMYYMAYTSLAARSPTSFFQLLMKVSLHEDFQPKPGPTYHSHVHPDSPNRIHNSYRNSPRKKPRGWQYKGHAGCMHRGKAHAGMEADFCSHDCSLIWHPLASLCWICPHSKYRQQNPWYLALHLCWPFFFKSIQTVTIEDP